MDSHGTFTKVGARSRCRHNVVDRTVNTDENCLRLSKSVDSRLVQAQSSGFIQKVCDAFSEDQFHAIRCLALGSISDASAPKSQLCLLRRLADKFNLPVSLWDPAFNELDIRYLEELGYTVEEEYNPSDNTLYYMAHPPIEVVEAVVQNEKPTVMLTNDLSQYCLRMTDTEYYRRYPKCATITHCAMTTHCDTITHGSGSVDNVDTDFQVVRSKRRGTNAKPKSKPKPAVEYNLDDCYFKTAHSTRFVDTNQEWDNAFGDLALVRLA